MGGITDVDRGVCEAPRGLANPGFQAAMQSRMERIVLLKDRYNVRRELWDDVAGNRAGRVGPSVSRAYLAEAGQIAFDCVWQQAIDGGVIETAQALCRQLADQGGDPFSALQPDGDPVAAFKLEHRAIDVQAAAEDLRKKQLESLRYAARILASDLIDPDVDKQVVIEGGTSVSVADTWGASL